MIRDPQLERHSHSAQRRARVLVLLVLLSLLVAGCKSQYPAGARQDRAGGAQPARQVKTARVEETPFGEAVNANGTLAAYDQTTASVKVPGRLRSITVDLGSVVRRGQVIAQVEPQDYNLRVQQAEAGLAQARARLGLSPDGRDDRVNPEQTGRSEERRVGTGG